MTCNYCGVEHQDWLEHTSYEHLGVKACLVSLKRSEVVKASDDVIHCRATSSAGPALGASAAWEVGVPVSFMFMPAGTHTITAGFRKGSIELTVQCDESTAKAVQASLDAWRAERPKQQPFGCIEHREHEASVCVSASCGFEWKEDGVYLAAEPTSLGANNVNGKVHRSWSPSFTTDADYAKATEDGGTLRFPEGVRGSRSNPAQITGVDFCVGTLTNRPAFIEMKPVKAREADAVTAGAPIGNKNAASHRAWFAKAHQESYDFHKPKADYYASKKGIGDSDDLAKFHSERAEFHRIERDKYTNIAEYEKKHGKTYASDATASAAVRASGGPFNTVLAREADADAILDKIVARNKPKPVKGSEAVQASGTSEGVRKAWESRRRGSAMSDEEHEMWMKRIVRTHAEEKHGLIGGHRGRTDSGVSSLSSTPVNVEEGEHEPTAKGLGYWKTGFSNHGFHKMLYTPSTLRVSVGREWLRKQGLYPHHISEEHRAEVYNKGCEHGKSFDTVLAREADADAILAEIVERNTPKPVTVEHLNAKFGATKTGDTRQTPDEILAKIYARAGLSR